jgi:serine/threonine protein kinase
MAPELLLHGRVSKASDVYAFGILLWELMTGQRVYGGRPLALVPHEVAVNNLRPEWPEGLPRNQGYRQLLRLAEECWMASPARR